jgi:hypothetical protein
MSRIVSLRLALPVLIAAGLLPLAARGQSQDSQSQSVADAARRARQQKKASSKPATVITDDTIKPAASDSPATAPARAPTSSPDAAPAPPARPTPPAATDSSSSPDASGAPASTTQPASATDATDADQKAKDAAELASLKQQLAEAQKGLDFLQRELALQQDTYYSNPDHSHNTAGKAKLDALTQQIADRAQELVALKERVAALEASVGTKAAAPAPANPPQS